MEKFVFTGTSTLKLKKKEKENLFQFMIKIMRYCGFHFHTNLIDFKYYSFITIIRVPEICDNIII